MYDSITGIAVNDGIYGINGDNVIAGIASRASIPAFDGNAGIL
ncbi:hypothetical protein [Rhodococcoides fascians]|nr:hypothetical protein [Rhodococcus fascians]MDQ0284800.1 hypothetical protein [Rhodococcus fascians]